MIYGARGLENRWLITLNMVEAREELLRIGLYLYGKRIKLKRYDDVLKEEWEDYLKYRQIQKAYCLTQKPLQERKEEESNSNDSGSDEEPETQIGGQEAEAEDE